jgi:hypothetical protein
VIYAILFCFGVAAVIAVAYVRLLERAEERRLAQVFFTSPLTTEELRAIGAKAPRAIVRRQRRLRAALRRALHR